MLKTSGEGQGIGDDVGESISFLFSSARLLNLNGLFVGLKLIFAAYVRVESPFSSSDSDTKSVDMLKISSGIASGVPGT